MDKIKKISISMLLLYICVLFVPISTSAHAYIIKSTPMENETLAHSPSLVSLEFSEAIQSKFDSLTVVNSLGQRVDVSEASIDKKNPNTLEAKVQTALPNGAYTISWKVLSADGHPVQGTIPFRIGTGADAHNMQGYVNGYIPQADMIIERGLLYAGFSLYLGVMLFYLVLYKESGLSNKMQSRSKMLIWISLLAISFSLVWNLPLQAKIYANVPWSKAFNISLWKEALGIPLFGSVWIAQMILIVILTVATYLAMKYGKLSSSKAWWMPVLLVVVLLVTKALNGHAISSKYREITIVMDILHLFAASLWIGGVMAIAFILPAGNKNKKDWSLYWDAIQRFSPWAMTAVTIILFTGVFSSTLYIPNLRSLYQTVYGQILVAKIVLFIIMGIFGLIHFVKGKLRKEKGIRPTAGIEFGMGIAVMIMAAILTNVATPPLPEPVPLNETKQVSNGYKITLHVNPNAVGVNTFDIDIKDKSDQPVTNIQQLTVTAYSLDMEMGRNTFKVPMVSPGTFQAKGMQLNMEGNWNITIHGLTTSLDDFSIDFHTQVSSSYIRDKGVNQ